MRTSAVVFWLVLTFSMCGLGSVLGLGLVKLVRGPAPWNVLSAILGVLLLAGLALLSHWFRLRRLEDTAHDLGFS